jgi:ribonuclease P protein component
VVRNSVKRYVREFFRRSASQWPERDVVVIARSAAAEADYHEVARQLGQALALDA